jgi:hypothetical protein
MCPKNPFFATEMEMYTKVAIGREMERGRDMEMGKELEMGS